MIFENIKGLCQKKKISISKLEKEADLGSGTIYRWQTTSPTIDSLQKVAKYFNVSINRLTRSYKESSNAN